MIKGLYIGAVVPVESVLRAKPDKSFFVTANGLDAVVGKPVLKGQMFKLEIRIRKRKKVNGY